MNLVADTNIFLAVALEEDSKPQIVKSTSGCDLYAPEILPYEIGNALSAMVKRRQIQGGDIINIFDVTRKIPVSLRKVDIRKALEIAIQHNLYAYDAYFLECCLALSSPLITLDARLSRAAVEMNIEILE